MDSRRFSRRNAGAYDVWVAKYDSDGEQEWIQQFGTPGDDSLFFGDLEVADGDIYLSGHTDEDLGGTSAGSYDTWVAKYNSQGTQEWTQQFGTAALDYAHDLSVDNSGQLYVTGMTEGSLSSLNAGSADSWVAKLNTDSGTLQDFAGNSEQTDDNPSPAQKPDSSLLKRAKSDRQPTEARQTTTESSPTELDSALLEKAKSYPEQPVETSDLLGTLDSSDRTFGSGTPYNDMLYTSLDTTYIEGETAGYDYFFPVDASDEFPGEDQIKLIKAVNNVNLVEFYDAQQGDRIILGTHEIENPFFLAGNDGIDNEWAVIQNFDYRSGHVQLKGSADDYSLLYATPEDGVATEGYYLFYTADDTADLIAFIYPPDSIVPPISGKPPENPNFLSNETGELDLNNPDQFKYAEPIDTDPTFTDGIDQIGTTANDLIHGSVTDT